MMVQHIITIINNNMLHRTINIYSINGKYHRLDGPAFKRYDKYKILNTTSTYKEYWIDDHSYTKKEYQNKVRELKKKTDFIILI